jgi:hypothetical protein
MKELMITRYRSTEWGVKSTIILPSLKKLYGLEPPWYGNQAFVSCIPDGRYLLLPWTSPKYGKCFAFVGNEVSTNPEDVPDKASRYLCLIHPANWADQLQGCLAPGLDHAEEYARNDNIVPAVWNSKNALSVIRQEITEPAIATIKWEKL